MKINVNQLNEHLRELTNGDPAARLRAAMTLAKFTSAEWEGSPDAMNAAVGPLVSSTQRRRSESPNGTLRVEAVKALGNIGAQSNVVVTELIRILKDDPDVAVRTEAAHALGKIGVKAESATRALTSVLTNSGSGDVLRGEAARALARVNPQAPGTTTALKSAASDRSGHVVVCAAEALWRVSGSTAQAVPALMARLTDPKVRDAAAQALCRIGPDAKAAVPALLTAAKDKNRLFHESVVMALRRIDPQAAAKAGVA